MKVVSVLLALGAGVSGTLGLALSGAAPYLAALCAALGAAWVLVLALRPRTPVHGLTLTLLLAAAGGAAARGHVILGLITCTLALFAWDAATMRALFAVLPPQSRRGASTRYAVQSTITAAGALGVPLVALVVRPRLGFPAALGLALAALFALGIALWTSGRIVRAPGAADDSEPAAREDAMPTPEEEGAADL